MGTLFAKQEVRLPKGNLTESTSSVLTIGSGTGAVIGTGTTIAVTKADTSNAGYVSSADWNTFNGKQNDYTTIVKEPTGFDVPENVIINYNSTTLKITLTGANWIAYYHGEVVPILTNGWISEAHPDVTGHVYFLSYNGSVFSWSDNSFPGFDQVLIASVNYGATDKYCLRESHGFMQWQTHRELHYTIGTYRESGGTIPAASYTLNSTTATDRRPTIDETVIVDEDLYTTLPALTSKLYTQTFLTDASLIDHTINAADIIPLSTNNPYYNSFSTPNWGQTLMPANSMTSIWIYAIPVTSSVTSQAYRFLFLQGQWITQAQSASVTHKATALASELLRLPSELNLGTLTVTTPEIICIARIIIWFTTNWSLASVIQLTGNKFSQIGSPAGNFLSIVASDATLTGNGTAIDPLVVAVPATKADLTVTSPILASVTSGVVNVATTISHAATDGNIHLPSGGSTNQILKNSGTAGTGSWGTVTENAGALAAITTIGMSNQLTNTLANGTAPMVITSATKVSNLNVDKVDGADLSVDGTFASNSDILVPSEKACKTYYDTRVYSTYEDVFTATLAQTDFVLTSIPASVVSTLFTIDGIVQNKNCFTLSTNTLTYTGSALAGGEIVTAKYTYQLVSNTDANAIHNNISSEISALTEKALPISADLVIIEDSAASNAKKKVQLSNISMLTGYIYGLTTSNAAGDLSHDITIATGVARDSTDVVTLRLSSAMTKQIDAGWAAGTGAGGLFSGSVGNTTWYYVFIIRKDSDGTIDCGFDTSITAANKPAGYTYYRRIGAVLTNGSANIIKFRQQNGKEFIWDVVVANASTQNPGTNAVLQAVTVPPNFISITNFGLLTVDVAARLGVLTSPIDTDSTPTASLFDIYTNAVFVAVFCIKNIKTDSSSRVRYRINASSANAYVYINTIGWIDEF